MTLGANRAGSPMLITLDPPYRLATEDLTFRFRGWAQVSDPDAVEWAGTTPLQHVIAGLATR